MTLDGFRGAETELVPGTLRGYRAWALMPGRLLSLSNSYIWKPGANAACCLLAGMPAFRPCLSSPGPKCSCGLYGHYSPTESLWYMYNDWTWQPGPYPPSSILNVIHPKVWGSIAVHGRVILGEKGLRAEYATVEAIALEGSPPSRVPYEMPLFANVGELIEAFPPQDMSHLLATPVGR